MRLDPDARRVGRDGREVALSKTEFDLLDLLLANEGIVLEHPVIDDRIWGNDFGPDSRHLAVHIGVPEAQAGSAWGPVHPHGARGRLYRAQRVSRRVRLADLLRRDCRHCRLH